MGFGMDKIEALFKQISSQYNAGLPHYATCLSLIECCLIKLHNDASFEHYGPFNGRPRIEYYGFRHENSWSRPVRSDIFLNNTSDFHTAHNDVQSILVSGQPLSDSLIETANSVIYTAVMSFASCYDIWKRSSRKTPGTFFEFFMAGLLKSVLSKQAFSKHIPLSELIAARDAEMRQATAEAVLTAEEGDSEESEKISVSTDLVISSLSKSKFAIIPLKITTRERIVQPFAHQRILDSAFGEGKYHSFLACISETQLDQKTRTVKQVCVPGTVKLFQKYLGAIDGIYYCDIPQRYASEDLTRILPVKSMGQLMDDLREVLS